MATQGVKQRTGEMVETAAATLEDVINSGLRVEPVADLRAGILKLIEAGKQ